VFTSEEGEGWQQLGEGLMPSSGKDAGVMLDGLHQYAEHSIHSLFSGTSLPDLHEALGAMFAPQPVELAAAAGSQLPALSLFDGTAASISDPLASTGESPNLQDARIGGADTTSMQAGDAASPFADLSRAVNDIVSKMTDCFASLSQGPMGLIGGLLNFLLTVFSQVISSLGQVLTEAGRAAAAIAADAWKKHLSMTT